MPKGVYKLPNITNEPIKSYAPGSPERAALKEKLNEIHNQVVDIPMIIGAKKSGPINWPTFVRLMITSIY